MAQSPSGTASDAVPVRYMHPDELAALLRGPTAHEVQVVDVRDDDFGDGCVRGALNVPSKSLASEAAVDALLDRLAREQRTTVVMHCLYSQQRGPTCARRLAERLHEREPAGEGRGVQVCVLSGGWTHWRKAYGGDADLTTQLHPPTS